MENNLKVKKLQKEIDYINNPRYKASLVKLIELIPDYFFTLQAASTGKYHPSFTLGEGGLLRHTKAAVRIAVELFSNECLSGAYSKNEKDLMIIAIIMHDTVKYGIPKETYCRFDHPILAANFIEENKAILEFNDKEIEFLKTVISSHMGPWTTNYYSSVVLPRPDNRFQKMVHMCDFLSSRKFLDIKFDENDDIID